MKILWWGTFKPLVKLLRVRPILEYNVVWGMGTSFKKNITYILKLCKDTLPNILVITGITDKVLVSNLFFLHPVNHYGYNN